MSAMQRQPRSWDYRRAPEGGGGSCSLGCWLSDVLCALLTPVPPSDAHLDEGAPHRPLRQPLGSLRQGRGWHGVPTSPPGHGGGQLCLLPTGCPAPTWAKASHKTFNTPNSRFQMLVSEKQGWDSPPTVQIGGFPAFSSTRHRANPAQAVSSPNVKPAYARSSQATGPLSPEVTHLLYYLSMAWEVAAAALGCSGCPTPRSAQGTPLPSHLHPFTHSVSAQHEGVMTTWMTWVRYSRDVMRKPKDTPRSGCQEGGLNTAGWAGTRDSGEEEAEEKWKQRHQTRGSSKAGAGRPSFIWTWCTHLGPGAPTWTSAPTWDQCTYLGSVHPTEASAPT